MASNYLKWLYFRRSFDAARITKFRGLHRGKTIFCVASGPSLNEEDLSVLNHRVVIFVNAAFHALARFTPARAYVYMQDVDAIKRHGRDVLAFKVDAVFKSFHLLYALTLSGNRRSFAPSMFERSDVLIYPQLAWFGKSWIPMPEVSGYVPGFSDDLEKYIALGPSVIFGAIQLAAFMGANRIVLLGVDMNYGSSSREAYFHGRDQGVRPLDYEHDCRPAFEVMLQATRSRRIELVNATCQTREDILPKVLLRNLV